MIWTIFWINVLTIAVAFKKRMVLYSLLNAVFLYLITGQAFQIQDDLERSHTALYLLNFISDVGFNQSLWYVFWISCVSLALAIVSRGYRGRFRPTQVISFIPDRRFYIVLFSFLCFLSFTLIFLVVGLAEFLHSSRPGFQSGTTIFLVLIFLGIVPLLLKILYRGQIGRGDILCCLVTFVITGAFSRTDLIFFLVAILLSFYYARGWAEERLTPKLIVRFVAFAVAVASIITIIGALHGAQNSVNGSFGDLVAYLSEHPEKSILSIEYNYRVGIEGMSGIAGIFTQAMSYPNSVHHDFGASWILQGSIQGLPGFLKPLAASIAELSLNLNWYPSSIVATAAETYFMSFGWFAVILYPASVYLLAWYLPLKVCQSQFSPLANMVSHVLMAWTILFVHGPLAAWIAVCLFYSLTLTLFWRMFGRHFHEGKVEQ